MDDSKARARAKFEAWVEAQARTAGSLAVENLLRAAAKAALARAAKRQSDEEKTA
jgi:hypothetical protein